MNKVILMGRLTRDPEVRYSQGASQTAVARFSVTGGLSGRENLTQIFLTVLHLANRLNL